MATVENFRSAIKLLGAALPIKVLVFYKENDRVTMSAFQLPSMLTFSTVTDSIVPFGLVTSSELLNSQNKQLNELGRLLGRFLMGVLAM